jgi:hypothetical protein
MVADAPIAAAAPFADISSKVSAFLASAKQAAQGGLTWQEFGVLVASLVRLCVETLDATQTLTGPEKRAIVLEAVGVLFDTVAGLCVPLAGYPFWLVVRPAARALVIAIAAGTIETLLPLVRKP